MQKNLLTAAALIAAIALLIFSVSYSYRVFFPRQHHPNIPFR
jgi:hypothetical protein